MSNDNHRSQRSSSTSKHVAIDACCALLHRLASTDACLTLVVTAFHFAAGLGSGILSAVLLQPADLLKTRVQQSRLNSFSGTVREIAKGPKPLRQLWRGTFPSALRTGVGSALYFSSLNGLRQYVARSSLLSSSGLVTAQTTTASTMAVGSGDAAAKHSSALPKLSNMANLTTGAVARASVGFVMMPITVIKVRYESNYYAYRSLWHASTNIFHTEGLRGFFSGYGATAIRDAPYAGLYVLFYEQAKGRLSSLAPTASLMASPPSQSPPSTALAEKPMKASTSASINSLSSVLAAGLATALTNPFDAVKTRIQLRPAEYGNMAHAAKLMVHKDGLGSLFDGLGLRMARKAMSSALAWTLYEELIRRAERGWGRKDNDSIS
ncbi:MAG: hypothetical protein M1840_006793 [Geoglossum simile]|nr:MAG: hypothetical protein M1840_006793 [Geoglossum simile]